MKFFTQKDFEKLLDLIKEKGIPWENINHFQPNEKLTLESYHPDYRDSILEFVGKHSANCAPMMYQIGSHIEHDHLLTDKQAEVFQKLLDKEYKSKRAKDAINEHYNAFTYEVIVYSKGFMKSNMRGEWWKIYTDTLWMLPLNASEEKTNELISKVEKEMEILRVRLSEKFELDAVSYRKKYLNLKFNPYYQDQEIEELVTEAIKQGIELPRMAVLQSMRITKPTSNMKPFKFKSTNRKVLLEITKYNAMIYEVDPIL